MGLGALEVEAALVLVTVVVMKKTGRIFKSDPSTYVSNSRIGFLLGCHCLPEFMRGNPIEMLCLLIIHCHFVVSIH